MKKTVILVLITLVSLVLSACQSDGNDSSMYTTTNASATDVTQNKTYTIETKVDNDEKRAIEYPQLNGQSEEYASINSLLYSEIKIWLKDEMAHDATIDVRYSVTLCNETYFCVLFEGDVIAPNAAHTTKVVKSVCVSLAGRVIIDPLDIVRIDKVFVERFKNQLNNATDKERFTDEQWESVIAYFYTFSNEELIKKIVNGEVALIEDGVLVCMEVPHAIGDYIKVSVKSP